MEIKDNRTKDHQKIKEENKSHRLLCVGIIKKGNPFFVGKKCNKLLAEANNNNELKCKIKCKRCGTINEV
ncbi:MAG: hypothetical protein A3K77_00505 [Euryarchaeota archaeon RBG_13_31_8]|nr:MAG: hypothetical protein A3K77_00505 [Euryarchaeota archaeon RBG_13_31_8]